MYCKIRALLPKREKSRKRKRRRRGTRKKNTASEKLCTFYPKGGKKIRKKLCMRIKHKGRGWGVTY
jgi:hypothetical protein